MTQDEGPTSDAERDAIDAAVALATHEAQEHPELRENDAHIAAAMRQAQVHEANSHRLAN